MDYESFQEILEKKIAYESVNAVNLLTEEELEVSLLLCCLNVIF